MVATIVLDGKKSEPEESYDSEGGLVPAKQAYADSVTNITQGTEVGEVMKTLFPMENMNTTKMLGNINTSEETFILAFLILNKMGVTPVKSRDIVLEKLLLSVSRDARGRDDGRDIMIGKKEQDMKAGMGQALGNGVKNFFGMGQR